MEPIRSFSDPFPSLAYFSLQPPPWESETVTTENLHTLLKAMGITPNYVGFHQLLCAVSLAHHSPDLLCSVTKDLYPVIAREYGTSWKAVERNIRAMTALAWSHSPGLVCRLAGCPLNERPKAARFIAILADYL